MRFLFTVKYLFQSNFSPLNVLYYLKDLKDRTRATHVAFHPYFQPEVVTYWLTAALLLREGGGCQAIVRPLKRNDSWKKAEIPRSNSPRVESRILYSLFFPFFFFIVEEKAWNSSEAFPSSLPPPPRGTWVFTRGNKSLGDKPRESHPHLLERFYFLQGNRLFEVETARLVRNRDYTGNGIGITKRNETFFSKRASIFLRLLWVVVQGVDSIRGIKRNRENNGGLFTR